MADAAPETWLDFFQARVDAEPDACALTILGDGDRVTETATYLELDRKARAVAVAIEETGAAGRPVIIAAPTGRAFVEGLIGCFFAGSAAVPLPALVRGRGFERVASVLADADAAAILTEDGDSFPIIEPAAGGERGAAAIAVSTVDPSAASRWRPPRVDGSTIAILQYTSGSTAAPSGVAVPHRTLVANLAMMRQAFGYDRSWRSVNWMPLHHDMGLIMGLLQPLACFSATVLLPPLSVVQRPIRLLRAIDRQRATTAGGPSFIFETCIDRVRSEDCVGLDLSGWRHAYCGAETVRGRSLGHFAQLFEPYGFRREALYPCYGLAEATLFVTGAESGAPLRTASLDRHRLREGRAVEQAHAVAPDSFTIVASGRVAAPGRIAIVDPDSRRRLADGNVGEIWVAGPHVADGYWRHPEKTRQSFQALIAGEDGEPWLRTGDLGLLRDGALFVVGRLKDVIVVRGANHHAEDFEQTMRAADPALEHAAMAAFAVDDGTHERLVVAVELRPRRALPLDLHSVESAIRHRIVESHGVRADEVLLLRPGTLFRTTSGKIRRGKCAEEHARGDWPGSDRCWLPAERGVAPPAEAVVAAGE